MFLKYYKIYKSKLDDPDRPKAVLRLPDDAVTFTKLIEGTGGSTMYRIRVKDAYYVSCDYDKLVRIPKDDRYYDHFSKIKTDRILRSSLELEDFIKEFKNNCKDWYSLLILEMLENDLKA